MANKSAAKIEFTGFEELLGAANVSTESLECERITYIAIQKLETYHNHPYNVEDNDEMSSLCDSIADYGILTPLLVRRTKRIDSFEIISGHRRARAAEMVRLSEVPAIILALNDDEADIAMVNANLQREHISISEKAKAYRIKYEAMKHQGQSGGRSLKRMEAECRDSQSAIQRLMRIANLSDDLLGMVDAGMIGVVQAADISVLTDAEQELLHSILLSTKMKISKNQAVDLKERSKKGELDEPGILAVLGMCEQKKKKAENKYLIRREVVRDYFDEEATETFMEDIIVKLLAQWRNGGIQV